MQFDGHRTMAYRAEHVFGRLGDAAFLVRAIPEATLIGDASPDLAHCAVRPNLGFLRGQLDIEIRVAERSPPRVQILLLTKGIGTSADTEIEVTVTPTSDDASRIDYKATVTKLGGLLKTVPAGLMRGAANKVIDDLWAGVERELAI